MRLIAPRSELLKAAEATHPFAGTDRGSFVLLESCVRSRCIVCAA